MVFNRLLLSQRAPFFAKLRASKRALAAAATCSALATTAPGCLGSDLGVAGGEGVLSKKFPGIDSATVISPSAVTVRWKPLAAYSSYNIYISTQDAPIGTSVFDSYTVTGLKPGTSYSFSVAGVSERAQDGIGKQVAAQTWPKFGGVTAATAKDSGTIQLSWNYYSGPTFQIFYRVGSPPSADQIKSTPNAVSQSNNGASVSGLQPNTTYYFSVTAKYPDGTSTLDSLTVPAQTLTAVYTSTNLFQSSLPTITIPATLIAGQAASFTVTGGAGSLKTYIFDPAVTLNNALCTGAGWSAVAAQALASVTGAGTATTSVTYSSVGSFISPNIAVRDSLSGNCAFASLGSAPGASGNGVQVVQNPVSAVPYVSATTPTSLTPLPTVAGPGQQLGPFPAFTVSGALPAYKTTLYHNPPSGQPADMGTNIGSITGNGTIQTLSSTPLPRGLVSVYPVVTSAGQKAYLSPVTVSIKGVDSVPYTGPTDINGGGYGGGLGTSMTTGDYNCDGYPDLAVGIPFGTFNAPTGFLTTEGRDMGLGAVAVYYGSATGLVGIDAHDGAGGIKPVTNPTGKNPLLIITPSTTNYLYGGIHFGAKLASGFVNGVPAAGGPSVAGKGCSTLIVGAPGDTPEGGAWGSGSIYAYYGSPNGLQVTTHSTNSVTCNQGGSYICGTGKFFPPSTDYAGIGANYYPQDTRGYGSAVGVGDFNGDGYDDVAVGAMMMTDLNGGGRLHDGVVYLYYGTPNGLSPSGQKVLMPAGTTAAAYSYFGQSVAFGAMSDDPDPGPYNDPIGGGTTPFRKKDLLISAPGLSNGTGGGAVFWVKGTSNLTASRDATGHLNNGAAYAVIQPKQCKVGDAAYTSNTNCGMGLATADLNQDGYEDVVFGAPWTRPHFAAWDSTGAVFAYYGSNAGPYNIGTTPVLNQITCSADNSFVGCNPQYFYRTDDFHYWFFGSSLAALGDTNGDGYPEIGIGANGAAPAKNGNFTYNGLAYVYYSGARGLSPAAGPVIDLGSPKFAYFGSALAGANFRDKTFTSGLCNAKKCNDIVVAAPGESTVTGSYGHGVAHLFVNAGSGFAGLVTTDTAAINNVPGKPVGQYFHNVRMAGDINGDGYGDVIAPVLMTGPMGNHAQNYGYPVWPVSRWGAVVYYGGSNGLVLTDENGTGPSFVPLHPDSPLLITDLAFGSPSFNDRTMGQFAFGAGDVNGDGFADIGMGQFSKVYLFYGSSNGVVAYSDLGAGVTGAPPIASPSSPLDPKKISDGSWVGIYHSGKVTAGDFNGDGYGDLAMGPGLAMVTEIVTVIYGSANGILSGGKILHTEWPGYAGEPDIYNKAVRTPSCTPAGATSNYLCQPVEICSGQTGACSTAATAPSYGYPTAGYNQVTAVMSVGDVNKDGTDDLLLGAAHDNTIYNPGSGAVYLYYGDVNTGISPSRYAKLVISPEYTTAQDPHWATQGRYLGGSEDSGYQSTLARGYDINGDGIGDFVVGAGRETTGAGGTKTYLGGAAYVIYGINGGYQALGAAVCASYPCTVTLTNAAGNVPDYLGNHIVENVNNSCDVSSNNCNPMRVYPYNTSYSMWAFGGGGIQGLGDVTGDSFGDVVIGANGSWVSPNKFVIYSGAQSGLQVASKPTAQPACANGACAPYLLSLPTGAYTGTSTAATFPWFVNGYSGAADIDKDGRRDFMVSSYMLNNPDGKAFYTGGFFLFH